MPKPHDLEIESSELRDRLAKDLATVLPSPVLPIVQLRKLQKTIGKTANETGTSEVSFHAPPALSIDEVCKTLKIGRSTFYEEVNSGRLKVRKIGNRSVVTGLDLIEYLVHLPLYQSKTEGEGE